MPKMTLKEFFAKIGKYSATAIPRVGNIYAQFLADKGVEDLKQLFKTLSEDERKELDITHSKLNKIQEDLNQLISNDNGIEKLTVVIPTDGEGGSFFPVTQVMPKCLVTIGKKSMLQHIIDPFYHHSDFFDKVYVITGKYSGAIEENVKQGGYDNFAECKNIKGKTLPDALLKLKDFLPPKPFLIHYNDVLVENCDWKYIYKRYFANKNQYHHIGMLLCSRYYPYPLGIGVIEEGKPDILDKFTEKPNQLVGNNLANLAIAIFEPEIFDYMKADHKDFFDDTIRSACIAKRIISLFRVGKWHHVQDLKDLYHLQNHVDLNFLNKRCM